MDYAVITAVGADRAGIVDDLADAIALAGANIEETKAAILGGEFAVIMLVSGPSGTAQALAQTMPSRFAPTGLTVAVRATAGPSKPQGLPYIIETVSLDTPGIVHAVTAVLRRHSINIDELESLTEAAPLSGAPLFRMRIIVAMTPGAGLSALRSDLAAVANEHDLDIVVKPALSGIQEA